MGGLRVIEREWIVTYSTSPEYGNGNLPGS
jgi:hypothetical protein